MSDSNVPLNLSNLDATEEPPQRSLKLASVVNKVRQAQKQNSEQALGQSKPTVQAPQSAQEQEEHSHWYSNFIQGFHHAKTDSENEDSQRAQNPSPTQQVATLNHAANAFTSSSRHDNLEAIESTVSSLTVASAAAPAYWLTVDDKGRRPPPVLFQLLKLGIVDSDVDPSGTSKHIVFRIELQYGDVKWVIRRTLYEFYKLHLTLTAKRFDHLPWFPNQVSYAISIAKASLGMRSEEKVEYLRETNLARRQALQAYLLELMKALNGVVAYDLYEFLEISALSVTKDMGWKGKEGYVETKMTDTSYTLCGLTGFSDYRKSWAVLRDSYIAFCPSINSDSCSDVFIFDQNFFVRHKQQYMGLNLHHIELGDNHRTVELKGEHNREMIEWMDHINKMRTSSPWVISHRFGSFAPQREDAKVRYYVDGKDYFHAVSDAILAAKSEIYIADWWLSPELYLRRPPEKNEEFRLDRLLKKKASEGIKIYIVVYKEISLALSLDSAHTKTWLQDLHPSIQVQRHPDHLSVNATQFWAHHEKICVIDCRLAFIGGLDLCFGRYDSRTHQLADYHPSGKGTIWPGQDYSNPRIKDFVNVKDYNNDLIEKKLLARMPWHDVSVGVAGQPARDIARHFVQRWNFVKREKGMKKQHMKFLTPKGEFVSTRNESGWTGSQKVQILRSSTTWSQGVDLERSIQDAYLSCIENAEHFIYIENQFFVTLAMENGNPDLKNTIGLALVNRIIRAHKEGKRFRVIVVMPLMPAFEADIMSSEAGTLRKVMHFQYVSICRGGNSVLERLIANGIDPDQYIGFFGLRSFDRIKHGKFDAIVEAVKEAERSGQQQPQIPVEDPQESYEAAKERESKESEINVNDVKVSEGGDVKRSKSLASKFLLDPIPKDRAAARVKALADRRKAEDEERTWDESITKRAMIPARKEHGFIPKATERSLEEIKVHDDIRQDTIEAERTAKKDHYRGGTTENSEQHLIDGLGTMVRSAIDTVKGTKEHGDLKPKHHKFTRNELFNRGGSGKNGNTQQEGVMDDDGSGSKMHEEHDQTQEENVDKLAVNSGQSQSATEVEEIIERAPGGSVHASESSDSDETVVDNEVDDFVTEQLYIHSKLMIVDDRLIIIGSANINDRSQVGYRDSEIAIVIEDAEQVDSRMNGEAYKAGKMAHALRADLFKEHLGLLPHVEHDVVTDASVLPVDLDMPSKDPAQARRELIAAVNDSQEQQKYSRRHGGPTGHVTTFIPNEEETEASQRWHTTHTHREAKMKTAEDPKAGDEIVMDPLHDDFYESWWKRVAKTNTEIFREVFRCVPDNTVETWDDYKAFVPDSKKIMTGHVAMEGATVENVTERLQKVTGHLVEFPTQFLVKENLLGSAVEGAVTPMEIFT